MVCVNCENIFSIRKKGLIFSFQKQLSLFRRVGDQRALADDKNTIASLKS